MSRQVSYPYVGFAFVCHDSAIKASFMTLAAPSVGFAFACRDPAIKASFMTLAAPYVKLYTLHVKLFIKLCSMYYNMVTSSHEVMPCRRR